MDEEDEKEDSPEVENKEEPKGNTWCSKLNCSL